MPKYHISEDDPKECSAKPGQCPVCSDAEHYADLASATHAVEKKNERRAGGIFYNAVQRVGNPITRGSPART